MALPITVIPGKELRSVIIVIGPPGHTIEIPLSGADLDTFARAYGDALNESLRQAKKHRPTPPPKPPPTVLDREQFAEQYGGSRRIASQQPRRWK